MERYAARGALCALCLSSVALSFPTSACAVVISELLYDATGTDAGKVFVELYGAPGTDLGGWSLRGVNGGDGSVYKTVNLSGTIPLDGVFVIGDLSSGTTLVPNADQIVSVDFQNGPDSVQLYNGGTLIDALGYGDFTGLLFGGEGNAAPAVPSGSSLARINPLIDTGDNFADFAVSAPTPGEVPVVSAVPLPASLYLLGSGLAMLATRRRVRDAA
ncbi:MAG TPA: lamin tail domain-containing protein [Gammaproteobacteria bacterium]